MPDIQHSIDDLHLPMGTPLWRGRVRQALRSLGGVSSLQDLYRTIAKQYDGALTRKHWKAKIRQVVQKDPEIERVGDGVWGLISESAPDASKDE